MHSEGQGSGGGRILPGPSAICVWSLGGVFILGGITFFLSFSPSCSGHGLEGRIDIARQPLARRLLEPVWVSEPRCLFEPKQRF